jgi:hypothetical protein
MALLDDIFPLKKEPNKVVLYPSLPVGSQPGHILHLAAASPLQTDQPRASTYIDKSSNYMIRINRTDSKMRIYFFSSELNPTVLRITFFPSGETFVINTDSEPLELPEIQVIEKIVLE